MAAFLRHLELKEPHAEATAYPMSLPVVQGLGRLEFHPKVTFLVGENGTGKSTLIEAVAIKAGFNPEGGTKNFTGSTRPSESQLHQHLTLARGTTRETGGFFLRAETMFNVATEAEKYQQSGWALLHEKSHGEAFLWVMSNRFRDRGLFILDEPEAALSPSRQLACLRIIHDLTKVGGQFVIATHSPILMAYPDAWIYELGEHGVQRTVFEETEHYRVTRDFMQNPERMLRVLFD